MTGKTRSSLLSLAIIAVLVFGAVSPTIAHADDGNPPDTPPTQASSACTANDGCPSSEGIADATSNDAEAAAEATSTPDPATTEAASTPDAATTEVANTSGDATVVPTSGPDGLPTIAGTEASNDVTTAPPATETAAPVVTDTAPAPDASVLNQVPSNTTVTVLDAQGQSQPLATQDTAAAIATTSDPIWCPAGQDPTPGANGCTSSFSSFSALLTFLSGNATYQGAGTIYVQQGTYNGGETSIDFNSPTYDLSTIRNADLTITGGWNTTSNVVDPTTTSDFSIPFLIGTSTNPWGGSLTINNITIRKPTETGLTLYAQGDITVSNVTVTSSVNGAGADLNAAGGVNINHSSFDRNRTTGAIVRAGSNVAVANSSFSNPVGGRVQHTGLDIISGGAVSLANVTANENREAGANINAGAQVAIANSFFSGTKSTKGTGAATTFLGYGLQVVTPDAIAIASVTANDNFLWGASFQSGKDIAITDSFFNANTTASPGFIDDTGLLIKSGATVSLNNIQANDNRLIGATIDAAGDVSINNSTFTNNKGVTLDSNGTQAFHGYGLNVVTPSRIFINQVDASNNTLFGAHLDAGVDVTVANSHFDNETSGSATDQTGRGLEIISGGNVFLRNVTASNNQTFGASIQAGGDIFLDTVTASNNGLDGLDAQGNCTTVFLGGGTYSNNGGYGLSVRNAQLNQVSPPVFSGNIAGDLFQDPGTCVFPAAGTTGGTGNGNSTGTGPITSSPAQGSLQNTLQTKSVQVAQQQGTNLAGGKEGSSLTQGQNPKNVVTLNSFLTNSEAKPGSSHLSIFVGNYAYLYFNYELHIVAFSPASNSLAMGGAQ